MTKRKWKRLKSKVRDEKRGKETTIRVVTGSRFLPRTTVDAQERERERDVLAHSFYFASLALRHCFLSHSGVKIPDASTESAKTYRTAQSGSSDPASENAEEGEKDDISSTLLRV